MLTEVEVSWDTEEGLSNGSSDIPYIDERRPRPYRNTELDETFNQVIADPNLF